MYAYPRLKARSGYATMAFRFQNNNLSKRERNNGLMMYWIYLVIFIAMVLTPEVITRGIFFLNQESLETVTIFLLGSTGFLLYLWKEKQAREHLLDKLRIQREATKISRDLMDSYSYIGEINRKLDILKNIALGLPETSTFTPEQRQELYNSIIEAVSVLGKCDIFILRFIHCEKGTLEKEIRIGKPGFDVADCLSLVEDEKTVHHFEQCSVIRAPKTMDAYGAFIILGNKRASLEDAEILKALASQALFLFTLEKRQGENNNLPEKSVLSKTHVSGK